MMCLNRRKKKYKKMCFLKTVKDIYRESAFG